NRSGKGAVKVELPLLSIEGISLLKLLFTNTLSANRLSLEGGAVVFIKPVKNQPAKLETGKPTDEIIAGDQGTIHIGEPAKTGTPKTISFKRVNVTGTSVTLLEADQQATVFHTSGFSLQLEQLKVRLKRKGKGKDKGPAKPAFDFTHGEAKLKEPVYRFPDGFYTLKARSMSISKTDAAVFVNRLEVVPAYGKYRFSRKKGYQTDRFQLITGNVSLQSIDIYKFLENRGVRCKTLTIEHPELELFRDKNIPRKQGVKTDKFPRQLMEKLKFDLKLDRVKITKGVVTYAAHEEKARRPGQIVFNDVEANLENLTNLSQLIRKGRPLILTASANVMGQGRLTVNASMPLNRRDNRFNISGSLVNLNMTAINSILEPNVSVRIDSGRVRKLEFSIKGDNTRAEGEMRLLYNNLEISVLKKGGTQKRRKFMSFLANTIIHRDNPKRGKPLRVGMISYKKEGPTSLLNYTWKALLEGIKSSIGLKKSRTKVRNR
ncbi:MAG: DUF748 domain-containing protein, partial [bacterium]|nr:DUF748 domain-containing protein [bacterium]